VIELAIAGDAAFTKQVAVTIASLSATTSEECRVFVLHDGYSEEVRDRIGAGTTDAVQIEWLYAPSAGTGAALRGPEWVEATLYRLRLEELLPTDLDRVIYLDTDVVVLDSLAPAWSLGQARESTLAVRSSRCPWICGAGAVPWNDLGLAPDLPYFNSGVLVIPLDRWRGAQVGKRALELMRHVQFEHVDQGALNAVLVGEWEKLDPRWNLTGGALDPRGSLAWFTEGVDVMTAAIAHPAVVHFTRGTSLGRPWQLRCTHPFRDQWFEMLDRTSWAGWRPKPPDMRLPVRVARRLRRAGRTLLRG
jgi:lipopolysaccharide biosynthesis glycosyltransferase